MFTMLVTLALVGADDGRPNADYEPKRGDNAVLAAWHTKKREYQKATAATYAFAYEDFWKAIEIKDYDGIDELEAKRWVVYPEIGTPVLVIETEKFHEKDPRADVAICRILDGPHKGKKVWVATFDLTQSVDGTKAKKE